jgi:hypothetical protein
MKLLGQLLIVVSLVAGALSAATAYHAWLDLPTEELVGLTLNSDAGARLNDKGQAEPLLKKDHVLTAEDVAVLRKLHRSPYRGTFEIYAVRVKEFSFARWQHKWGLTVFVVAMLGLLGGSLLTRRAARRRRAAARRAASPDAAASPEAALRAVAEELTALEKSIQEQRDESARLRVVVERVGALQRHQVADFIESHDDLIGRLGIGPAAEVMDRFAAAERQINRAWSAASDGVLDEAEQCLAEAAALLEETAKRLHANRG